MAVRDELSNFIWQIADLLRGPYRPPQYERVMLPMTVLRRFDCVLEPTKAQVLAKHAQLKDSLTGEALDAALNRTAGQRFHNHSPLTFEKLKGDPDNIDKHLQSYIDSFSANVSSIFAAFEFTKEIEKMHEANLLYLVVAKFCDVDLHPDAVDNIQMGLVFEDLVRRFNEQANETAGDHFTPREVIRLMVDILFAHDDALLTRPGTVRKLLDPACGTGGMLAEAQNYLRQHHAKAELYVHGQDFNPRAYAIAASDLLIKGREKSRVALGDSLTDDKFSGEAFDYFLANPPFGVDWKRQQKEVVREHEKLGYSGRFGAGVPRVNDGSLLFLQHMLAKFEPVRPEEQKHGSRLGIVFSGSPLFSGGAGSGESNIRRWIIENDWLEAIIALPEQMFYNIGIGTYVWIATNRKEPQRRGKIQLIDARARWKPLRRSLGDKRRELGEDDIAAIVREYGTFAETETSKVFDNAEFGYTRVTVERPLRLRFQINLDRKTRFLDACPHLLDDVQAIEGYLGREPRCDWNAVWAAAQGLLKQHGARWKATEQKLFRDLFTDRDPAAAPVILKEEPLKPGQAITKTQRDSGWFAAPDEADDDTPPRLSDPILFRHPKAAVRVRFEPDPDLRDFENVPLKEDVNHYFRREVLPHVPDAWMDRERDKVGYEINFNRHFYRYTPPRPLEEIDADLKAAEERIVRLLKVVTA
jgi:type I restriction enzyme M protein